MGADSGRDNVSVSVVLRRSKDAVRTAGWPYACDMSNFHSSRLDRSEGGKLLRARDTSDT